MEFLRNFYNYDFTGGKLVSERVLEDNWNVAAGASAIGTVACVDCWIEDFRKDIARNKVPTLILHRRCRPHPAARCHIGGRPSLSRTQVRGASRRTPCVLWTHAERINAELVRLPRVKD